MDRRYLKYFQRVIKKRFPEQEVAMLEDMKGHYRRFASDIDFAITSPNPIDRRLSYAACCLALIRTMQDRGGDFETTRTIVMEATYDFVRPKNVFQAWMKKLPPIFFGTWLAAGLVKLMNNRVSKSGHPDGFLATVLTDKEQTYGLGYGIDILRCGICTLFKKHDAGQYVSILCDVDKVTSGLAGLELIRTTTIAGGAERCDFRFRKK